MSPTGDNPKWNTFVHTVIPRLRPWNSYFPWMMDEIKKGHPVLVVKYEDLKSDSLTQVKRMLQFLRVPYSDEELHKRLSTDYGRFHRKHTGVEFDHYTPEQRQYVTAMVLEAVMFLTANNNGTTYGIEDYL